MYIDRLQLRGFKSFGGAHDLKLSPGFTAIVGPNGSGKSNLLDALRWSLGDSNPGRLRISRQSDLLFQGSASEPVAKEANVSLHLRDEEYNPVIKRIVSEDGTTTVYVDGERTTLTDLDIRKRDWKLEGDRFAFIGQGEVTEVIDQTPKARRMKLETLFGIDLYRKNREEVSSRLDVVREEYEKLRNLMSELTMRREEIEPDVKKAAQLREILDAIEEERQLLYWLRRAEAEADLAKYEKEIAAIYETHNGIVAFRNIWEKANISIENELDESSHIREQQIYEMEQCKNRYDNFVKSGYASSTILRSSSARLEQAENDLVYSRKRLERLLGEQKITVDENKSIRTELQETEAKLAEAEHKWQEYNDRLEAEKDVREQWNREKGQLEGELQQLKAKLAYLGKELLNAKDKKANSTDPTEKIDKEISEITEIRDKKLIEQQELAEKHTTLYARVQTLAGQLQRAKREASQARSQYHDVADTVRDSIYPRPVSFLLSASKLNRLNANPRPVVDVFTSDPSLSTALEGYLGGRKFQLLVENLEEAERCIDQLKVNRAGRAVFLPLERVRPRYADTMYKLPKEGIVGWAIDLVTVEPHWLPAIQQIMGDLLIVTNYKVGQNLVRNGFRNPIVTMDGDVFQPGGTVSGGRSQNTGKVLEMKNKLAVLERKAEETKKLADELTVEFKKSEEEEISLSEKQEQYIHDIRELDGKIAVLKDTKDSYKKEQQRIESEKDGILATIKEEGIKWRNTLQKLEALEEQWNKPTEFEDDYKIIEEREKLKAAVAVSSEKLRSQFALMERISGDIKNEKRKITDLESEISDLDRKCVQSRANLAQVGKHCLEIHNRRKEITEEMEKRVSGYTELAKKHEKVKTRLEKAIKRLDSVTDNASETEQRKSECERRIVELTETWNDQFPYPGPEELPTDVDVEELRKKIKSEERKIRSYGDIDMGVLSEDRNLKDRLAFLGNNLDDVNSSARELERLIENADTQAHEIFTKALNEVDSRFCNLFVRLFGGGEAHLKMTDGDTIWDTGVDVIARPPGKHPQNIKQLSGGEQSLTAISMLFASMEVAGCPLAVLDEVDAALDEVNLKRFSELTKEYAKNRQILAMTHRRVTMERADVLYGVTLAEPGLSQLIGVRTEDWA